MRSITVPLELVAWLKIQPIEIRPRNPGRIEASESVTVFGRIRMRRSQLQTFDDIQAYPYGPRAKKTTWRAAIAIMTTTTTVKIIATRTQAILRFWTAIAFPWPE